jgi:hypothetical protein
MLSDTEVQDPKMLCQKWKVSNLELLPPFRETSLILSPKRALSLGD